MEATEGTVRVTTVPHITVGDTSLAELVKRGDTGRIGRAMLELVKKVGEQREEIIRLKGGNDVPVTDE